MTTRSRLVLQLLVATGAISAAPSANAAQTAPGVDFRLSAGRAGRFAIGMSIDDVKALAPPVATKLVDLELEGAFTPAIEIRLSADQATPSIIAQVREAPCPGFRIWGMTVEDPRFRTTENVGVGSTFGELQRAYPALQENQEEGEPKAIVQGLSMTLFLTSGSFADTVTVAKVWLWLDPNAIRRRYCAPRGWGSGPAPSNEALLLAAWDKEAAGSLRSRAAIMIERRSRAPRRYATTSGSAGNALHDRGGAFRNVARVTPRPGRRRDGGR